MSESEAQAPKNVKRKRRSASEMLVEHVGKLHIDGLSGFATQLAKEYPMAAVFLQEKLPAPKSPFPTYGDLPAYGTPGVIR